MHVCGLNSNIVYFSYIGLGGKLPLPPNYLSLLGLPTNAVFVCKWGVEGGIPAYKVLDPHAEWQTSAESVWGEPAHSLRNVRLR